MQGQSTLNPNAVVAMISLRKNSSRISLRNSGLEAEINKCTILNGSTAGRRGGSVKFFDRGFFSLLNMTLQLVSKFDKTTVLRVPILNELISSASKEHSSSAV